MPGNLEGELFMIKSMKRLFAWVLIMLFLTGCGSQDATALSENIFTNVEGAFAEEPRVDGAADDAEDVSGNDVYIDDNAAERTFVDEKLPQGADGEETPAEDVSESAHKREAVKVKGIYVTGPTAGTEKMDELIALVEETELNAMVIDVKNDEGVVTYKMQSDTVLRIESGVRYIPDIAALIKKLHEKDIYVIARIVAFKDPYLAEKQPELSLKTDKGTVFRDKNKEAWVNPYKHEVWDYLVEIGAQAAKDGFDEIQFDYIRFSTDAKAGSIDYGEEAKLMTKDEAITGFTRYAYDTLHPLGVAVSADVFGTIIDNEADAEIVGQNYQEMAAHLDYICPMVYPSHYSYGVYGLEIPDKAPYDTVYQAMLASVEKLEALSADPEPGEAGKSDESEELGEREESDERECSVKSDGSGKDIQTADVRVWLQDFTASWIKGHITYGPAEVRAQIQAVYDAGYEEWILWNARMNYTEGALLPHWQETEDAAAD